MKKPKAVIAMLVGTMLVLILGACGTPSSTEQPSSPKQPLKLTISGGTVGGVSNLAAQALAGVAKQFLNIDSTVITLPTAQHSLAVHKGEVDIAAPAQTYTNWDVYTGTGRFKAEEPAPELRVLYYNCAGILQILVPAKSDIKTFADLKGKRISTGKKGFGSDYQFERVCEALGFSYENDFKISYLGHEESAELMRSGKLDAIVSQGTVPLATEAELDLTYPLRMVSFSEEEIKLILEQNPTFVKKVVQKAYHNEGPVTTLMVAAAATTTTRLPEDVAYGLVKNYLEHPDFVGTYLAGLKTEIEEDLNGQFLNAKDIPFHAGAVRYYKEKGLSIPPDRIPPEYKD